MRVVVAAVDAADVADDDDVDVDDDEVARGVHTLVHSTQSRAHARTHRQILQYVANVAPRL